MCVQLHGVILIIEFKLYKELRLEITQYNVRSVSSLLFFNQLHYIGNCSTSSNHYTRGILFSDSTLEFHSLQVIKNFL